MAKKTFILGVSYDRPKLDFARLLEDLDDVDVSRAGLQRRVQITMDEALEGKLRDRLPAGVRIEPRSAFRHGNTE